MFNHNKIEKLAKLLKISPELTEIGIKKQAKYIKINPNLLLKSFVCLYDAQEEFLKEKYKVEKYKTKNIYILKYREEIVNLYLKEEYGYLKISKAMKVLHNCKISKSSIEYFIKSNNIERAEDG